MALSLYRVPSKDLIIWLRQTTVELPNRQENDVRALASRLQTSPETFALSLPLNRVYASDLAPAFIPRVYLSAEFFQRTRMFP
jgi:hypothetical protein